MAAHQRFPDGSLGARRAGAAPPAAPPATIPAPPGSRVVRLLVNATEHEVLVRPQEILLDVLREDLRLVGTRRGCDMGTCGCCTVEIDGRPALSCLTLAVEAAGRKIRTVEGLRDGGCLHPIQRCFETAGAAQCGFCTSGFLVTIASLLDRNPNPSEAEWREEISGNLCRCTGYVKILDAAQEAARMVRERRTESRRANAASGT
ncbi:MAG: (2Fe-2S)-binding protein [Planctomycetes bacterium]|nr:(2Fe-2S)-binding protein [Planctomycetota bacterium]